MNHFDREHHSVECRIMPNPRPKVLGLSASQVRASRTPIKHHDGTYEGVFRPHMEGGPVGLGMISTARTAHSPRQPIALKGCALGTVRSGCKRRAKKPRPRNTVFIGRIPSQYEYDHRIFLKSLRQLTGMYGAIARDKAGVRLEDQYEELREQTIRVYGREAFLKIERMEQGIRERTGR